MAWNTGNSYTGSSVVNAALINGIGNDLRTWGGDVDGAGHNLMNLGGVGIGLTGPPGAPLAVESAVINSPVAYISTVGSGGGFGIYNTNADTGSRNWSIASNYNVFGDFAIAQSAARAGNPLASTANVKLYISAAGKVGIGTLTPGSPLAVAGLPIYANNAAAITGGLSAGDFYRTGANPDAVCVVH